MSKARASSKTATNRSRSAAKKPLVSMAVQEARARAEALFSSLGEGAITTDERGQITRINQAALDILGYDKEDLLGKWFPEVIIALHDDGTPIDKLDRPITQAFLTGKSVSLHTNYRRKNDTIVPVAITVSPIYLHNKPIGAVEIFRDISMELKNDKMKTEFISVASHQLRTPLTAIRLYAEMLHDGFSGELNEQQHFFLKTILSATSRMNELINTLLNITRIEAGSIAVTTANVKLEHVVEEIVEEFRAEIAKKNLTLTTELDQALPVINTDRLLAKEVFANLISNAVKYTPDGGSIIVGLAKEHSHVLFSVKDTGYGIPISEQKYIFTKFFRSENIITEDVSGTGLGLYLIKAIADNLGGELWFESEQGKGSAFYFSLPLSGSEEKQGRFKLQSD